MAALAQRLNELATANSQGLLNDDEYRLLRQNLFEQNVSVADGAVPIAYPAPTVVPPKSIPVEPRSPPSTRTTKTLGVASLIRRATGRSAKQPSVTTTTIHDAAPIAHTTTTTTVPTPTRKRSTLFPRILLKKPNDPAPLPAPASQHTIAYPTPSSPSSSTFSGSLLSNSYSHYQAQSLSGDVFAEHNLFSASDIRAAIASTQAEAQRLLDAFNNLEATTLRRVQKQRAGRLPASTPANVSVLLEGREWREHRRVVQTPPSPKSLRTTSASTSPSKSLARSHSHSGRIPRSVSLAPIDIHAHTHSHSNSQSHAHTHSHSHTHAHAHHHHHLSTSTSSRAESLRSTRTSLSQSKSISSLTPGSTPISRNTSTSKSTTTHPSSPLATSHFRIPSLGLRRPSISSMASTSLSVAGSASQSQSHSNSHSRSNSQVHIAPPANASASARPKLLTLTRSASQLGHGLRRLRGGGDNARPNATPNPTPTPPAADGDVYAYANGYGDNAGYGGDDYGDVDGVDGDGDVDAELHDIRTRRADLVARYTARVDFLRAKLKGAELHEKLLRK